jgi:hypothetical protein
MGSKSPTSRTIEVLKDQGMILGNVEKWNPHARIRQDLFGFIDLIACDPVNRVTYGLQVTSGSNTAARIKKICDDDSKAGVRRKANAIAWIKSGNRIQVWGWRKLKAGWEPKVEEITLADLES